MKLLNDFKTRFLYNHDFDRVIEIDCNSSGKYCWEPDDMFEVLRSRHGNGMVAVGEDDYPVGFCIYSLKNVEHFEILHLAVDDMRWRQGIGTKLINKMKRKLNVRRSALSFDIPESGLGTQLFLKEMGFKARLIRNSFEDIMRFKYENS